MTAHGMQATLKFSLSFTIVYIEKGQAGTLKFVSLKYVFTLNETQFSELEKLLGIMWLLIMCKIENMKISFIVWNKNLCYTLLCLCCSLSSKPVLCWVSAAPVISVPPQDVQNFTGNDVIFGCEVSAYPMPHLEWKKKGNKMFLPGDDAHISVQVKLAFTVTYDLERGVRVLSSKFLLQHTVRL